MNKLLFVDTETGGLDHETCSLLSVGLAVWQEGRIVAKTEILIMDTLITFSPEALKVNQIDFRDFIKKAVLPDNAIRSIKEFCLEHFGDQEPITLAGHNVAFDIAFIKKLLKADYSKLFSHRSIETSSILKFLWMAGKIKDDCSASDKAFSYFKIDISHRHSALGDAIGTAELYTKLLGLVQGSNHN
ncbi:MAG TPA: 3'-5' exonuclease [Desulfosporosinus sp.]